MAVHFLHVSKAGGSALRHAIRATRVEAGRDLVSPWGPVWGHDHRFCLTDVGPDEMAVITLRDPVSRFVSGFFSRLRKGAPRYFNEWTPQESQSFEWFSSPQALADALAESRGELRERAEFALESIRHVRDPATRWTGDAAYVRERIENVLYFARQETLDADWELLKELLELPGNQMLPRDPVVAHRATDAADREISPKGVRALREWYANDYEVLELAENMRQNDPPGVRRSGASALVDRASHS
jgi:sulfotransferase famil protein